MLHSWQLKVCQEGSCFFFLLLFFCWVRVVLAKLRLVKYVYIMNLNVSWTGTQSSVRNIKVHSDFFIVMKQILLAGESLER